MKNIITLFIILLGAITTAFSQQIPLYSQYNVNPYIINPGYAGSKDGFEIRASYRAQWIDFPTSPETYVASVTTGFKRTGLGLLAFSDKAGSLNRTGFLGSYAYHIPLFAEYKLSIGISMKYLQYRLVTSDIEDKIATDPAILSAVNGRGRFDGTLGFYFYDEHLYFGLSAPNLIQTKFDEQGISDSDLSDVTRHFFGLVGYDIDLGKINIEPSVLVRRVQAAPFQVETNLKTYFFDKQLMLGVSYRTSERTIAGLFGIKLDEVFTFTYMFEISDNGLQPHHFGSHEFTFGLDLNKKKKGFEIKKR
jgi:type IX secretion system PorP/SprF family membrane protein